jgi:hypothetical protein
MTPENTAYLVLGLAAVAFFSVGYVVTLIVRAGNLRREEAKITRYRQ